MDLKTRISVFLCALFFLLIAAFSVLVYREVEGRLHANAERSLSDHLTHDAQHLGHSHEALHARMTTIPAQDIYLRVYRDGKLVEDSFPKGKELAHSIVQRLHVKRLDHDYEIVGHYDLGSTRHYLAALRNVLGLGCLAILLVMVPLSLGSAKLMLAPFRELARTAAGLSARTLSFRFPEPRREDEHGTLVVTINQLLNRLQETFGQLSRFATNASHELRTPLAVIIGQAEMALRRPRDTEEYRAALEKILTQAKRLRNVTNRLLLLADLERAGQETPQADIPVRAAVDEVVSSLKDTYRTGKTIEIGHDFGHVVVRGNPELFQSVVSNLVENAIKYSDQRITIGFTKHKDGLRLKVEDDGPGIPEAEWPRVFEPFFRRDATHDAGPKGHGLGLAIVKTCVDACRGAIRLGRSRLGGLSVEVFLPEPS